MPHGNLLPRQYKFIKTKERKTVLLKNKVVLRSFLIGALRRGNKPPVLPGEEKKLQR